MRDDDIYERDADGQRKKLSDRGDYTVVLYVEPVEKNQAALGYDIGSDPTRRAALDRARDTGRIVATAPITLVQERGTQLAILFLRPVYINAVRPETEGARRKSIKGYAVGVYRVGDILDAAIREVGSVQTHIGLYDQTDGPGRQISMYRSSSPGVNGMRTPNAKLGSPRGLVVNKVVNVAGRVWVVNIYPAAPLITPVERFSPCAFFVAVVALTALLYGYLVARRSRSIIIELEVNHRTRELADEVAERKSVEAALRKSERTYAKLTEMAPIGILIYRDRRLENANLADVWAPNLVLLDLNLPTMTGHEVLKHLKEDETLRRIPVIVLSSSAAAEDVELSYDLSVNSYVQKPIDMPGFVEVAKSIAVFWLTMAKLPELAR
jgi:CheY-like chemotaxis protein